MKSRHGTVLLVLLLLASYAATYYSRALPHDGGAPAFFLEKRQGVALMLGEGFPRPGIHQFSDGVTPAGVIEMTDLVLSPGLEADPLPGLPLESGEVLDIVCVDAQVSEIRMSRLPAQQRMALGIALHPDRMNEEDWQALPGIGAKLALRIEEDRQQNGDFGSLEGVERVRGIGPRRIEAWRKFFSMTTCSL